MFLAESLPKCDARECERHAITQINGLWLCGEHTVKAVKKLAEQNKKIMMEE